MFGPRALGASGVRLAARIAFRAPADAGCEPMADTIYTRTGDRGETGLFGGRRVPKDDLRVEACGAVDELNALLGVVAALPEPGIDRDRILALQRTLFEVGADLATPPDASETSGSATVVRLQGRAAAELEHAIDAVEAGLAPLTAFILPGGSPGAAALHHARTVCRRAERRCVALARSEPVNPCVLQYLNRLSDLLFVLAREANRAAGSPDVPWK